MLAFPPYLSFSSFCLFVSLFYSACLETPHALKSSFLLQMAAMMSPYVSSMGLSTLGARGFPLGSTLGFGSTYGLGGTFGARGLPLGSALGFSSPYGYSAPMGFNNAFSTFGAGFNNGFSTFGAPAVTYAQPPVNNYNNNYVNSLLPLLLLSDSTSTTGSNGLFGGLGGDNSDLLLLSMFGGNMGGSGVGTGYGSGSMEFLLPLLLLSNRESTTGTFDLLGGGLGDSNEELLLLMMMGGGGFGNNGLRGFGTGGLFF
jgi:hypothetical protein